MDLTAYLHHLYHPDNLCLVGDYIVLAILPSEVQTDYQLIHAGVTPKDSQLTAISLYITRKFQAFLSSLANLSPYRLVHLSFYTLTKNVPKRCTPHSLPRPSHAVAAMIPWFSKMYLKQRETGRAHEVTYSAVPGFASPCRHLHVSRKNSDKRGIGSQY